MKTKNKVKKEELKAKAMLYDNLELKKEIDNKLKQRIQRQRDFKEAVLIVESQETALRCMNVLLADAPSEIEDEDKFEMEWLGVKKPISMLKTEFNLNRFNLAEGIRKTNYLRQALVNDGLTDKEICDVLEGKYKQDFPKDKPEEKESYIG